MIRLKTPEEIKKIRESCRLLSETHEEIGKLISPGITTCELDRFAQSFIEKRGGTPAFLNYLGYPASLCTSVNEEVIHGIPSKRKLLEGDIISLDLGINLKGFFSDAARTYGVGRISPSAEKLIQVTQEALYLGIGQAVAGNRISNISQAIFGHAKKNGYGVVREYCGHGVGFSPHEDPQVPNYVGRGLNPRLRPGMVLAVEPMINEGTDEIRVLEDDWTVVTGDGKISAHWEHTIVIHGDFTEILTNAF